MNLGSSLPIVDGHVHLWRATAADDLMDLSEKAGLPRIHIVCSVGTPERALNANAAAYLAKARFSGRIYGSGGLHYGAGEETTPRTLLRQGESLLAAGCDGVKMLEGKPTSRKRIPWRMDDPVYALWFGFLQEVGVPILWHVADPETFWDPVRIPASAKANGWDYTDGTYPSQGQLFKEAETVLERYPRLRVVFAHFYFHSLRPERLESLFIRFPTVHVDITPGSEMYRNFSPRASFWREFFTRWQDRILFGTDNMAPRESWIQAREGMRDKVRMMRQFLETNETFEGFCTATSRWVTGIGLSEGVLRKIYAGNFERLYGAVPRPLDMEAVLRHCDKVAKFARRTPGQEELLKEMKEIQRTLEQL